MKLNLITLIGLALLVAIAGGILFLMLSPTFSEPDQSQKEQLQSAVARSGNLTISASGTGELVAISETSLSFEENGELVALNVGVGDQVHAGDLLAVLQLDQTEAALAADITEAALDVLLAEQELDQKYENAQLQAAEALLVFEESQQEVESVLNHELEQALALQSLQQAKEAVQEAEMNLNITNSAPSQEAISTTYASLQFKEHELNEIQEQLERAEYQFKSASNPAVRDRLTQEILSLRLQQVNQQVDYENTLYKYETMEDPPDEIALSVAEARLITAQAQLAEAEYDFLEIQDGPPAGDLAMAEVQYAAAQTDWERLKDGPDLDELALLEARLAEAELKLETLKAEQLTLDLVAPMDGTVLTIAAQVGDRVGIETILTLADMSQVMISVSLDEVDQASIQIGNRVEISFDVMPERKFQGEVVQIKPSLVRVGNSQAFRVWVLLDELPNDLLKLPLGINAVVDVITGEAQDSVLVSRDALHEGPDDGYSVYVIEGENLEQRLVQIGLMDATTSEIVAGLQPGEQVAIGHPNMVQE